MALAWFFCALCVGLGELEQGSAEISDNGRMARYGFGDFFALFAFGYFRMMYWCCCCRCCRCCCRRLNFVVNIFADYANLLSFFSLPKFINNKIFSVMGSA